MLIACGDALQGAPWWHSLAEVVHRTDGMGAFAEMLQVGAEYVQGCAGGGR